MAEISTIELKDLEYHYRLDPDFYKPSFLKIYEKLEKLKKNFEVLPLTEFISIPVRTGTTPKEREPLNDGTDVLFIKTDSVRKGFIDYGVADSLPLKAHKKQKLTSLEYEDIILTVVGATRDIIGRAGLYLKKESANINQSDALIRIDKNKIEAGFVSTFINSKYGRNQLWRYSGQTGQVTMNCREVEQLFVPILPKEFRKKIHEKVLVCGKLRESSKENYAKAEKLLMDSLNINEKDMKDSKIFISELEKLKKENRLDAEFFMPKYEKIISKIKKYPNSSSTIWEEFIPIKTRFSKKKEEKYNYIEIGNISLDIGDNYSTELFGEELPTNAKIKLGGDEILVSKVRPTRGAVSIIKNYVKGNLVCSAAFVVLKEKGNFKKEVLSIFLRSKIGKNLLGRRVVGSSYPRIDDESVLSIEIPLIESSIQKKICDLVNKAYNSKIESKRLLEEAKEDIERKIEEVS